MREDLLFVLIFYKNVVFLKSVLIFEIDWINGNVFSEERVVSIGSRKWGREGAVLNVQKNNQ